MMPFPPSPPPSDSTDSSILRSSQRKMESTASLLENVEYELFHLLQNSTFPSTADVSALKRVISRSLYSLSWILYLSEKLSLKKTPSDSTLHGKNSPRQELSWIVLDVNRIRNIQSLIQQGKYSEAEKEAEAWLSGKRSFSSLSLKILK